MSLLEQIIEEGDDFFKEEDRITETATGEVRVEIAGQVFIVSQKDQGYAVWRGERVQEFRATLYSALSVRENLQDVLCDIAESLYE